MSEAEEKATLDTVEDPPNEKEAEAPLAPVDDGEAGEDDVNDDGEKEERKADASPGSSGKENDEPTKESPSLPLRPIKKARTAYFIFADEKRAEIQAKHPGEGVGVIARATGQMWSTLPDSEREAYQSQAAQERERVAQELAKYKLEGIEVPPSKAMDPFALILPVARIRKICKLDPDVTGVSKEAAMLITKCAELATIKLGQESVKVAQLQNRRKLLPEDVAQVCATREQFLFLREDVKDLVRDQKKDSGKTKQNPAAAAAAANSKPLTAYFGAKQSS